MDFINNILQKGSNLKNSCSTSPTLDDTSQISLIDYEEMMPFLKNPKQKEISFNLNEAKKVQYIKTASTFELTLQISGKTICQDLILTAKANNNGDPIPIKCIWKRMNNESIKQIKNINSFSYMPNGEDIGSVIQIEACSLENPSDKAIAQYGPINVDKYIQNAIEELLTARKSRFNLVLCEPKSQEKNYILFLDNEEIKLVNVNKEGNQVIIEKCHYSQNNPIIRLSNTNVTKFQIIFVEFEEDEDSFSYYSNKSRESRYKSKNEYEFLAMSKQCRELIYIIIQYFILNEKFKNNKIFYIDNYNSISSEVKKEIYDLIGDLKIHKEQNTIIYKNMKYLEYENKQLNDEFTTLEENFQITLEKINGKDTHFLNRSNSNQYNSLDGDIENDWKKKYDELNILYTTQIAKEKALKEEKSILLDKDKDNKNIINQDGKEIEKFENSNEKLEKELNSTNKTLEILERDNNNYIKKCEDLEKEIKNLQDNNNNLSKQNKLFTNSEKDKAEINEIKKNNEVLSYENKNLIMQKNLLTNQKNDISKEIEKIKRENEELKLSISKLQQEQKDSSMIKRENEMQLSNIKKEKEDIINEYNRLKESYELLKLEHENLQEMYDKSAQNNLNASMMSMSMSMAGYRLSPEDYQEYDELRKNKDETEAIILQLQANNEAQDIEINNLKAQIEKIKSEKK